MKSDSLSTTVPRNVTVPYTPAGRGLDEKLVKGDEADADVGACCVAVERARGFGDGPEVDALGRDLEDSADHPDLGVHETRCRVLRQRDREGDETRDAARHLRQFLEGDTGTGPEALGGDTRNVRGPQCVFIANASARHDVRLAAVLQERERDSRQLEQRVQIRAGHVAPPKAIQR